MFTIKIDEQLQLGLLEKRHAARIFEITNEGRAYLAEWLPWVDFTNEVKDSEKFIEMSQQQFANNNGFNLGIVYEGEIVGVIGLHNINHTHQSTSIGYWLGQGYQGKGIMTRATKALITYCFEELALNRIEIRAVPTNTKSCAIPERLGFTLEGVIRQNENIRGTYFDHNVYSMLKQEWSTEK